MNPGESSASIVVLPRRSARSRTARYVASLVTRPFTISTNFMTAGGFMKCMPMTRSGRPLAVPRRVIEIDEVLDARITSGGQSLFRRANKSSFTASISVAASITKSVASRASSRGAPTTLVRIRSPTSGVTFRRVSSRSTIRRMALRAASRTVSETSWSRTPSPACAATSAMPLPIWPAPTTPIRSMCMPPLEQGVCPPGRCSIR